MFERFTRPARVTVEEAVRIAGEAGAQEVRPEHLLRALLEDETTPASRVLAEAGAPLAELRAEVDRRRLRYVDGLDEDDADALRSLGIDLDEVVRRIERDLGGTVPRRGHPRFSRSAKKVLELALREAVALRHDHIGTEHLLLGLVRDGDRVVTDSLAVFGIERDGLRRLVADGARKAG
jgi:ATP-dependent Clp protease ATP-binding subunit ClpA